MPKNLWFIVMVSIGLVLAGVACMFLFAAWAPLIFLGLAVFVATLIFVLNKPWLGVVLVAFFLPFERVGALELSSGTVRISQIIALAVVVAWLMRGLASRRLKLGGNPTFWPLLFFVLVMFVAMFGSENIGRALTVFLLTLFLVIFSLVIPKVIFTRDQVFYIISALLLTSGIICLFGLFQFGGDVVGLPASLTGLREGYASVGGFGFPRVQSTALEPLYLANFLLIPLAISGALFLYRDRLRDFGKRFFLFKPFWLFVIFALGMVNMLLTLSRGGYLGFLVLVILMLVFFAKTLLSWKNLLLMVIVVILVIGAAWGFLQFAGGGFGDLDRAKFLEHATNFSEGPSVEERYSYYERAWFLVGYHPWLGVGPGNYGPMVADNSQIMPEDGWLIVNNEYLEVLTETGWIGLVAFVVFLASVIVVGVKSFLSQRDLFLKVMAGAFLIALIAILTQYATFSTLYIVHVWFVIGMIVAIYGISVKKSEIKSKN